MSDEQPVVPEPPVRLEEAPTEPAPPGAPGIGVPIAGAPPAFTLEPQPAPDSRDTTISLIATLERLRKSRVLTYNTSLMAKMGEGIVAPLYDQLENIGEVERIDLVLDTLGGNVEIPWRMVSLIREYCEKFSVLIPHRAASAGTILTLGADEIVMTKLAALGPIDPSRTHPLLPGNHGAEPEPVSVQDMRHAMQFIREAGQVNEEFSYSSEAMAQIFTALFDKLHPLAIGAIEQSYALSKLVSRRCLETHMTAPGDADKITQLVDQLCDAYKSHAYQIPRREAIAIGLKVKRAGKRVEDALMRLYRHFCARPLLPPAQPLSVPVEN